MKVTSCQTNTAQQLNTSKNKIGVVSYLVKITTEQMFTLLEGACELLTYLVVPLFHDHVEKDD